MDPPSPAFLGLRPFPSAASAPPAVPIPGLSPSSLPRGARVLSVSVSPPSFLVPILCLLTIAFALSRSPCRSLPPLSLPPSRLWFWGLCLYPCPCAFLLPAIVVVVIGGTLAQACTLLRSLCFLLQCRRLFACLCAPPQRSSVLRAPSPLSAPVCALLGPLALSLLGPVSLLLVPHPPFCTIPSVKRCHACICCALPTAVL